MGVMDSFQARNKKKRVEFAVATAIAIAAAVPTASHPAGT